MIWKKITAMKQQFIPIIPSSTGFDWNISNMKINLWYCKEMKQWRWTLTDDARPIVRQESGQRPFLRDAMNDVANTVEYMMDCKQLE
jgi:hypothetical protein